MTQSNILFFNGVLLENILKDATANENHCQSCSCLTGTETNCRTVEYDGKSYEEIPTELIRKAAYKIIESVQN